MFLRELNDEQKKLFLGLAYEAAKANDILEDTEKQLIKGFSEELGIGQEDCCDKGFEYICNRLNEISTRQELIKITFEILGVMMGDTCYDSKEKEFMASMTKKFSISEELLNEMEIRINEYTIVYERIIKLTES